MNFYKKKKKKKKKALKKKRTSFSLAELEPCHKPIDGFATDKAIVERFKAALYATVNRNTVGKGFDFWAGHSSLGLGWRRWHHC